MKESCHTYEGVMSHIAGTSYMAYMKESYHTYEGVMPHMERSHGAACYECVYVCVCVCVGV